jgi:hypothetical protein
MTLLQIIFAVISAYWALITLSRALQKDEQYERSLILSILYFILYRGV